MTARKNFFSLHRLLAFTSLAATLTLSGCGGSSNDNSNLHATSLKNAGVVASVSSDFSAGGVNVINLDSGNYGVSGPYHETGSDIIVVGGTGHYYLLEKFGIDTISKVDISNLAQKTWDNFSALRAGEKGSANPYDLIKVNDQKAYLLRYDSTEILAVNPSATNEADFITDKTLDLSKYVPADNEGGSPHVSAATLVGNKLFVTMQRLNSSFKPTNTSYVAVFNTLTDKEIDTGQGENGLKGIPLLGTNPDDIQYHEGIGLVVRNLGTNFPTYGNGTSLDIIDVESYTASAMIPATKTDAEGQILDFVIIDETHGYIINLASYQNTTVQSFNPETGRSSFKTIGNLSGSDFRDIELSPEGNLWVADASIANPSVRIFNPIGNREIKVVESPRGLLPNNIAFVTEE